MQIKILQWNVWYKEDIEKVAAVLKQIQPDIASLQELTIGLQEAHPDTVQYLAEQLGNYNEFHNEVNFGDWSQVNAIISRYPLSNQTSTWINEPTGSGGFDDEYRAYLEVNIDINGKELCVGTTHMSFTDRFQETERKYQETEKLLEYTADKQTNFVLTGDLNALPDSYTIKKLSEKLKNAGPDFDQKTWTTKPFSYEGFEANTLDWRLDYTFTTPDLKIVSADIIKTNISDHLPLLLTLEF